MTKNITVSIPNNNFNSFTFGGLIYFTDFYTNYSGKSNTRSPISTRILQDWSFDRMCQKNTLKNDSYKNREVDK